MLTAHDAPARGPGSDLAVARSPRSEAPSKTVFVNGRFLFRPQTGVDRYAVGILSAIDKFLGEGGGDGLRFVLLAPRGIAKPSWVPTHIAILQTGLFRGQIWEQLSLPWLTRGRPLVNLCNTGPVLKRRQIATIHDATPVRHGESFTLLFRWWYRLLIPMLCHQARFVVTVSKFSKAEIKECYGVSVEKTTVVYNGVDHVTQVSPDYSVMCRLGLTRGRYVLGVATHAAHKNVQTLYALAPQLRNESLAIVLVGGGNRHVFAAPADGGDTPLGVVEAGFLQDAELVALYRCAVCFVFPSLYEGFGIPPVEAMALGCPVIASKTSAMPEVLGDAALYVDPRDAREIAVAVKRVVHDAELREELTRKGLARAKLYRWDASARAFLSLCANFAR